MQTELLSHHPGLSLLNADQALNETLHQHDSRELYSYHPQIIQANNGWLVLRSINFSHRSIADHSFSADRQKLAVTRDSNVELYSRSGSKFVLKDELEGYDKTVTSVDIAPNTGRIVTCSQGMLMRDIIPLCTSQF